MSRNRAGSTPAAFSSQDREPPSRSFSGGSYPSMADSIELGRERDGPLPADVSSPAYPGPLSAPSNPEWRRRRLLAIGTESGSNFAIPSEAPSASSGTPLIKTRTLPNYGTLPSTQRREGKRSIWSTYRHLPSLPPIETERPDGTYARSPPSPLHRVLGARPSTFLKSLRRPPSAYDFHASVLDPPGAEGEGARINGIRVWYSSFTSIDWLHDAIKDSSRMLRLRKRRSARGRLINALDRSLGWIVVTIVGFITAMVAFMIVRSEQWLFNLKEGYCNASVFKAKRFCCPSTVKALAQSATSLLVSAPSALMSSEPDSCDDWTTWADAFGLRADKGHSKLGFESWAVEYIAYTVIALLLALCSALLTINLTASTSFITRKDSGVLSSSFSDTDKNVPERPEQKRKVLYFAAGSGIPEIKTILSGFVIHGYLGARVLAVKGVGLALSVASGLSLGKEGPFVHIASCIGNIVSRWFSKYETNEGKRREILSAASAAGVAVAFGAPIGGVLFSLEEVSYFFPPKVMWRSFFCAMIAAMTLKFLDPFGTGKLVLFQVTYDKDWHAAELLFFILLGVLGGVYGAYFSKLNYRWSKYVRNGTWLKTHPIFEVLLVTLVTALLSFSNPFTRMGGTELVYNLFAECRLGDYHEGLCVSTAAQVYPVIKSIAVVLIVKGCLTIVTFGIKVPAGIFIPTLGVGACMGRIVGLAIQYLQWKRPDLGIFEVCHGDNDCIIPGVYAMVGAAAALSGVTRTTVSLAVIMFELTDTLTYVVPVMLAVLVAKTVADALEPKGIYDLVIELSQLPYLDHKHEYLWGALQVSHATDAGVDVIRLDRDNTVKSLRDQLQRASDTDSGFPILARVDGGLRMIGYIGVNELEHALTIVADQPSAICLFHSAASRVREDNESTVSSVFDGGNVVDPFDFSVYMDQAPLTAQAHAPLELIQQLFVKLGARYVVVTNAEGFYEGVIDKKHWLAFLDELEKKK